MSIQASQNIPNAPVSFNELLKKANNNDISALNTIARYYAHGQGVQKDDEKAFYYYKKAAELGDARAQNSLGTFYLYGRGVEEDTDLAVQWYKKAAAQKNVMAQHNLGLHFMRRHEYKEAFTWFQKAAEQGHAIAQSILGTMYAEGEGVEQNSKQAFFWQFKSAKQGHAIAQHNVAQYFYQQKDYKQALYWYNQASKQNMVESQHALGHMYENGLGTEKDFLVSGKFYHKAAKNGRTKTQEFLYEMNKFCKKLVQPNPNQVEACFIAAGAKYPEAQKKLADFYKEGYGVEKDMVKAYAWMKTALSFYTTQDDTTKNGLYAAMNEYISTLASSTQIEEEMNAQALEYVNKYGANSVDEE